MSGPGRTAAQRSVVAPRRIAYKWIALSNTTVGTLMSAIDGNIVVIALPTIARELPGTSLLELLWILLGYSLVTSVVLLSFGRLSDQFGRARLYTLGFAFFTLGSFLCGLAQTGDELIAFRIVQAIGAGFIFSNSAAILTDAFPANERGKALGVNQISLVIGAISGLLLGGVLTSVAGWRWIFFVNIPIGIIGTVWSHYQLRELAALDSSQRIDWAGNAAFAGGLIAILVAVTFGALGAISATLAGALFALGAALLVAFGLIETRVDHPMFDLGLFRIREFSASSIAMFLNALARGAFSFVLVFYLQGPPHDLSPITAGLYLVPVSVSLAAFGPISGSLSDRWGPSGLAITGLVVSAIGFLALTNVGPGTTFWELLPAFVLVGAGMGIFASPNRAAMMNAVAPHRRGIAAGTGTTLINAGTTLSLGLAIVVMGRSMSTADLEGVFLGLGRGAALPLDPFLAAVHLVFFVSAGLLLAAVIPSVWRRRGRPRTDRASGPDSGGTLGK